MKRKYSAREKWVEQRPDLTGEHSFGDAGQAIFAVVFAVVWVLDTAVLQWTTAANAVVPAAVRVPIAVVVLLTAGYLALTSMRIVFGQVRETPAVIRNGVFRYLRHPMYLSEVLLYAGLFILSMSLAALAVAAAATVFLFGLCRYEEKLLLDRFGDDYRDYMRETRAWLPRLRRRA